MGSFLKYFWLCLVILASCQYFSMANDKTMKIRLEAKVTNLSLEKMNDLEMTNLSKISQIKKSDLVNLAEQEDITDLLLISETPNTYTQKLYNYEKIQFIGQIALGSKKQVMKVIFDSGSSALWVSAKEDTYAKEHKKYTCDGSESTTCKVTSDNLEQIVYGSGAIIGKIILDDVWVPNLLKTDDNKHMSDGLGGNQKSASTVQEKRQIRGDYIFDNGKSIKWGHVKNQHMLLVELSPGLQNIMADGVFGLGPVDRDMMESVFTNQKAQGVIDKEQFAFYLSTDEKKTPSELVIGGFNSEIVGGENVKWHKIAEDDPHWSVKIDGISIDGKQVRLEGPKTKLYEVKKLQKLVGEKRDTSNLAVIDSGTSMIILFKNEITAYIKAASERNIKCGLLAEFNVILCEKTTQPKEEQLSAKDQPNMEFIIDGKTYKLDSEYFAGMCITDEEKNGDVKTSCAQMLKYGGDQVNIRILGMPFMQGYYCIFDRSEKQVAFVDIGVYNDRKIATANSKFAGILGPTGNKKDTREKSVFWKNKADDAQRAFYWNLDLNRNLTISYIFGFTLAIMCCLLMGYFTYTYIYDDDNDLDRNDNTLDQHQRILERTRLIRRDEERTRQEVVIERRQENFLNRSAEKREEKSPEKIQELLVQDNFWTDMSNPTADCGQIEQENVTERRQENFLERGAEKREEKSTEKIQELLVQETLVQETLVQDDFLTDMSNPTAECEQKEKENFSQILQDSPRKVEASPEKRQDLSQKQQESPTKREDSPQKRQESPENSPQKRHDSSQNSPKKIQDSPKKNKDSSHSSPKKSKDSSEKGHDSPQKSQEISPRKQPDSTVPIIEDKVKQDKIELTENAYDPFQEDDIE